MHRRRIAAAVLAAALVPALSGCWNGYQALTTTQPEGGQVTSANVGDVQARGLLWVRDLAMPQNMTLTGSFVLTAGTTQPDELVGVTTDPATFVVGISDGRLLLLPGAQNRVGFNSDKYVNLYGNTVEASAFLTTTLKFKRAGEVTLPILVVPNTGTYEGIRPNPPELLGKTVPQASAPAATPAPASAPAG